MDGPTAAIEAHAGPIVWLASYPKSGNTWLRAFLTSYQRADHEAFSINGLVGPSAASRLLFDAYLGCSSSDMTAAEILAVRPRFHALLGRELTRPAFVKVHDAYIRASQAAAVFPRTATAGAVYLVRNPLDVAVSLAHHDDTSVDTAITKMNHAATLAPQVTSLSVQIPQPLLTWSAHVTSWLRDAEFPVHAARYEDLLADPAAGFGGIVRFCGLEWDPHAWREPSRRPRSIVCATRKRVPVSTGSHRARRPSSGPAWRGPGGPCSSPRRCRAWCRRTSRSWTSGAIWMRRRRTWPAAAEGLPGDARATPGDVERD